MNKFYLCLFLYLAQLSMASAGIIVGGTRVVFNASKNEAILSIKNPDKVPYLIQSWVDSNGINEELKNITKAPFIVTPPLFRLEAKGENILRIIPKSYNFPEDKESIYWMNIKAIPTVDPNKVNVLQFTFKTRIKFFYRPQGMNKIRPEDFYSKINFSRDKNKLIVKNPSPFFITFYKVNVGGVNVNTESAMISPYGEAIYSLPESVSLNKNVTWQLINDYGGSSKNYDSIVN